MELTNPAVTEGVNLFVNIVVGLIAFVAAVSLVDIKREKESSED